MDPVQMTEMMRAQWLPGTLVSAGISSRVCRTVWPSLHLLWFHLLLVLSPGLTWPQPHSPPAVLQHTRLTPVSGPWQWLFPWPRMCFLSIKAWFILQVFAQMSCFQQALLRPPYLSLQLPIPLTLLSSYPFPSALLPPNTLLFPYYCIIYYMSPHMRTPAPRGQGSLVCSLITLQAPRAVSGIYNRFEEIFIV